MSKDAKDTKESRNVIEPQARRDKSNQVVSKPRRKGIPVPVGCTFQDLSTEQRKALMTATENRWKTDYNKKRSTVMASMTIDIG